MKVSTKGEYAVICMLTLAKYYNDNKYISLNDIAKENNLSLKYLEKIMGSLKKHNYFDIERGINGGYKLSRKPEEYTIYEILKSAEGRITPLKCVETGGCTKGKCISFKLWVEMYNSELKFLKSKTLKDFL